MTWRRLRVFLENLPEGSESAFRRALDEHGEARWTVETHLLAGIFESLQVANWQRTEDGAKGRKAPKPIERPGAKRAKADKFERINHSIQEWKRRSAERQKRYTGGPQPPAT